MRCKGRPACNLTVHATHSGLTIVCLSLTNAFKTFLCSSQSFMYYPFQEDAEVDSLASKIATLFHLNSSGVEDEILTLEADIELKSRAHGEFWNLLTEEMYPNMRKCATAMTALFGSAYLCESAFSRMKTIKSKYRSTMTDDHLEVFSRLAVSSYCPDYASLAASIQCKSSD